MVFLTFKFITLLLWLLIAALLGAIFIDVLSMLTAICLCFPSLIGSIVMVAYTTVSFRTFVVFLDVATGARLCTYHLLLAFLSRLGIAYLYLLRFYQVLLEVSLVT